MTTYRNLTVVGLPDQVANILRNHSTAGTLVAVTAPRRVSPTDPRIRVGVRLLDTTPASQPVTSLQEHITNRVQPARRQRIRRHIAIATTAAAVVVALVVTVAYLVGQLVAFLVDNAALIAGLLAVAALILAALRGATGSGKRHCPGC